MNEIMHFEELKKNLFLPILKRNLNEQEQRPKRRSNCRRNRSLQ